MMLHVYAIRDERLNQYGTPIYTAGDAQALKSDYEQSIRALDAQIQALTPVPGEASPDNEKWLRLIASKSQLQDAVVYQIGDFDDQTAEHVLFQEHVLCFRVKELF